MKERIPENNLEVLLTDQQFKDTFFLLLAINISDQKFPQFKDESEQFFEFSEHKGVGFISLNRNPKHRKITEVAQDFIAKLIDECKTLEDFRAFCAKPQINIKFPDEQQMQQIVHQALELVGPNTLNREDIN